MNNPKFKASLKMTFARQHILTFRALAQAQGAGVDLRERQLIRDPDILKRPSACRVVIPNPAAVRVRASIQPHTAPNREKPIHTSFESYLGT